MNPKRYRLYIDESGDHTYSNDDKPEKRYLGLTGLIIESEYYRTRFQPELELLKQKHFPYNPDEPVILHRKDLIGKHGPFWRLRDPVKEKTFNEDFLNFLKYEEYTIITVVIDKKAHVERYQKAALHPYHYCMIAMLERYCGFLNYFNTIGDVLAESRGGKEDLQLKEAYQHVCVSGTQFRNPEFFQKTLTSREIKLKPKSANIAGTQTADSLAHPCKTEIIIEQKIIKDWSEVFGRKICEAVKSKYNRHIFNGRVQGYGKVFLG
jgi:hypothetical protein